MFLTRAERDAVDARVAAVEAATGVQIVTAVIGKADTYPELPWTAFAVGAALAALATVIADALRPDWVLAHAALMHATTILGIGAACALLAVFVPGFARLFLRAARRDLEVRQYARSLFVERELFRTPERTSILILVCLFERKVELLPDTGYAGRVNTADWHKVVARMTAQLGAHRPVAALEDGVSALSELLAQRGFRAIGERANVFPDRPIEVRGE